VFVYCTGTGTTSTAIASSAFLPGTIFRGHVGAARRDMDSVLREEGAIGCGSVRGSCSRLTTHGLTIGQQLHIL
jgi:hypothetical protein